MFGVGQYEDALLKYEHALQIASEVPSSEEVRAMCHGNRGACFLKLVLSLFFGSKFLSIVEIILVLVIKFVVFALMNKLLLHCD